MQPWPSPLPSFAMTYYLGYPLDTRYPHGALQQQQPAIPPREHIAGNSFGLGSKRPALPISTNGSMSTRPVAEADANSKRSLKNCELLTRSLTNGELTLNTILRSLIDPGIASGILSPLPSPEEDGPATMARELSAEEEAHSPGSSTQMSDADDAYFKPGALFHDILSDYQDREEEDFESTTVSEGYVGPTTIPPSRPLASPARPLIQLLEQLFADRRRQGSYRWLLACREASAQGLLDMFQR
ncbi:hypothetical protein DXG01_006684, partial [Tephrocybe rancida]